VVDRCESAVIVESETEQTSSQDRRSCEVISQTPGHSTLVSVNAPLQLGGRSHVKVKYPDDVVPDGFDGCIKNLYHNGQVSWWTLLTTQFELIYCGISDSNTCGKSASTIIKLNILLQV